MRPILICLCSALLLVACGLKGPLYLPDKERGKETEPQAAPVEPPPEVYEDNVRLSPTDTN